MLECCCKGLCFSILTLGSTPSAAVLEEKAAAMMSIGIYAEVSLAAFAPYLEKALSLAADMSEYFHEDLREQAYTSLPSLLKACLAAYPAPSGERLQQHCGTADKRRRAC